jgi:hypothetical protein
MNGFGGFNFDSIFEEFMCFTVVPAGYEYFSSIISSSSDGPEDIK